MYKNDPLTHFSSEIFQMNPWIGIFKILLATWLLHEADYPAKPDLTSFFYVIYDIKKRIDRYNLCRSQLIH